MFRQLDQEQLRQVTSLLLQETGRRLLDGRLAPHQHVTAGREDEALTFRVSDLDPAR